LKEVWLSGGVGGDGALGTEAGGDSNGEVGGLHHNNKSIYLWDYSYCV